MMSSRWTTQNTVLGNSNHHVRQGHCLDHFNALYLLQRFLVKTFLSECVCVQSVKRIVEASEDQIALCPGLGPQKVSSLSSLVFIDNLLVMQTCCERFQLV